MSTGWLGVDVPRALLNVHYFDVIDWAEKAEKKDMTSSDRWALLANAVAPLVVCCTGLPNIRLLTPRLKEMAESINPDGRYWVVPFALDPALYPLQEPVQDPVVGMIGSMHWEPSRSAAERLITRIWPLVKHGISPGKAFYSGMERR